jgi:hypothetical protein
VSHNSSYQQGHQFRDDISLLYSSVKGLVIQAYGDDFTIMFEWDYSGGAVGYLSNMTVVHAWTLFENLMRNAFIYSNSEQQVDESLIRKNNYGWEQMRKWLKRKNILNKGLMEYETLISELDARRNCLVHRNGVVDEQYITQATKYGGIAYFDIGKRIWTDWKYHEQISRRLISFQMLLWATKTKDYL